MLAAVQTEIKRVLAIAGIAHVVTDAGRAKQQQVKPYAFVQVVSEETKPDGSLVARTRSVDLKTATRVRRRYRRDVLFGVAIVGKDAAVCDEAADLLLATLRGCRDSHSRYIRLEGTKATWTDDESFLRDETRQELVVLARGGVYEEKTVGAISSADQVAADATIEEA